MYELKHTVLVVLVLFLAACSMPIETEQAPPSPTPHLPDISPTVNVQETREPEPSPIEVVAASRTPTPPVKVLAPVQSTTPEMVVQPLDSYQFVVQAGSPVLTSNFVDLAAGCDWMGIGGQVFGGDDQPVTGLIAEVGGSLGEDTVLSLALTGSFSVLGQGGYLVKLSDRPLASENTLWVQLFDLDGSPLSEKVYFSTFAGGDRCEKNLVIINFRELGSSKLQYYIPSVFKNGN